MYALVEVGVEVEIGECVGIGAGIDFARQSVRAIEEMVQMMFPFDKRVCPRIFGVVFFEEKKSVGFKDAFHFGESVGERGFVHVVKRNHTQNDIARGVGERDGVVVPEDILDVAVVMCVGFDPVGFRFDARKLAGLAGGDVVLEKAENIAVSSADVGKGGGGGHSGSALGATEVGQNFVRNEVLSSVAVEGVGGGGRKRVVEKMSHDDAVDGGESVGGGGGIGVVKDAFDEEAVVGGQEFEHLVDEGVEGVVGAVAKHFRVCS